MPKQFYVSVSRARELVRIYTDDKEMLLENAAELGTWQSALELVTRCNPTIEMAQQRIREELQRGRCRKYNVRTAHQHNH